MILIFLPQLALLYACFKCPRNSPYHFPYHMFACAHARGCPRPVLALRSFTSQLAPERHLSHPHQCNIGATPSGKERRLNVQNGIELKELSYQKSGITYYTPMVRVPSRRRFCRSGRAVSIGRRAAAGVNCRINGCPRATPQVAQAEAPKSNLERSTRAGSLPAPQLSNLPPPHVPTSGRPI